MSIALCERELEKAELPGNIVVDCSHGNSNKDPGLQSLVAENVANQILEGNRSIVGLMLESNLHWGSQPIPRDRAELRVRRVGHRRLHRLGRPPRGCCSRSTSACAAPRASPSGTGDIPIFLARKIGMSPCSKPRGERP